MHKAGWSHLLGSKTLWITLVCFLVIQGVYVFNLTPGKKEYKEAWSNLSVIAKTERNMLSEAEYYVLKEYRHARDYKKKIDTICADVQRKLKIPLFYEKSAYTKENLERTQAEYEKMKSVSTTVSPGLGVIVGTDGLLMAILLLILIMEASRLLYIEDWEKNRRGFILATRYGRGRLFLVKSSVLLEFSAFTFLLFQGMRFLYVALTYGFGDWKRAIQSVWTCELLTKQWSVGHYLLVYVVAELLVLLVAALVIQGLAILTKRGMWFYLVVVCIGGVELGLYKMIPTDSWLAIFHDVNMFSYLQMEDRLGTYNNLNLLGNCVNEITLMVIVLFVVAILSFFIAWKLYHKTMSRWILPTLQRTKKYWGAKCSLWRHECYKVFWANKAVLFLALFVVIQLLFCGSYNIGYENEESFYYYYYVHHFEGVITEKTAKQIEKERENFKIWNRQLETEDSEFERQKLEKHLKAEQGFMKFYQLYEKEKEKGSNYILDSRTTNILVGNGDRNGFLRSWCVGFICLIFLLYGVWCVDRYRGLEDLVRTTRYGCSRKVKIQWLISFLLMTVVYVVAFLPSFALACKSYDFQQWGAPAKSMEQSYLWPDFSSVGVYVGVVYVFRYLIFLGGMILEKQILSKGGRKR